ncbi:MAG TPA: ion channel [Chthoniobacterales bacterium]
MKKNSSSISVRSGNLEFLKLNATRYDWRDTYQLLLNLSWPRFAAFIFGLYLLINLVFAVLYFAGGRCIAEMAPGSFGDAFFFSVETLATVGYGHMYPDTLYGHLVTTGEIMVGMFGLAVITGLIFVRFSRPTARVLFSKVAVIAPFDGVPTLMIRVANLRHHAMVEADFRMMLLRNEPILEGDYVRRFHPLKLNFDHLIAFPAALTVRHQIDQNSPFHGMTAEDLKKTDCRLMASIVCVDTVIPAPVQTYVDYSFDEIQWDRQFVEIYTVKASGRYTVDYGRFHETEEVNARTTPG